MLYWVKTDGQAKQISQELPLIFHSFEVVSLKLMVQRRFYAKLEFWNMVNMELGLGVCTFSCQCSAGDHASEMGRKRDLSGDGTSSFTPGLRARDGAGIQTFGSTLDMV